ncbi:hypothetical protein [Paraburkholderia youngii]|uniref:hypothetical protein n=1 Tax=Paraburkholderia youngii TaxID=2782701 RepID=UPI003D1CA47E
MLLKHNHKLADRLEHVAQYALERIDPAARRRYLSEDIAILRGFVVRYSHIIRARFPWTLPDEKTLALLHDEAGRDQLGRLPAVQMAAFNTLSFAPPLATRPTATRESTRAPAAPAATAREARLRRVLLSPVVTVLGFLSLPFAAFAGVQQEMVKVGMRGRDKARERANTPAARAAAAAARARELELFREGVNPLALVTEWDDATGFERLVTEGRAHVRVLTLPMLRRRVGIAGALLGVSEDSTTELRFYARPSDTWRPDAIADLHAQSSDSALTPRERVAIGAFITATQTLDDFQASLTAPDVETSAERQ